MKDKDQDSKDKVSELLRQKEDALRASELRYRRLFESAQDGILILDFDTGKILDVNPYLIDLLGYSHEDFLEKFLWEVSPFKDTALNKDAFIELQQKGYIRYEALPLQTGDGRSIDVEFVSNSYLVDGLTFIQCNIRDITDRKEVEAGLEKARKELAAAKILEDEAREYAESIINTVREPLIALDQDLRVVTVSRSFYEFFKVKPEETVGHLVYDLGNKQWDIPKLRELLETILPEKATFDNYEVEHDFADIGRRTMLLNARQIQRRSGKERVILLAIEDITKRKRAEEQLRIATARTSLALDILKQLNQRLPTVESVKIIVERVQEFNQLEAVAIRLRDGEDFPYFMYDGFADDFIEAERYLCARHPDGEIIRDEQGTPYLECMCGNVIKGRTDRSLPFFTERGSFWSNCTTDLLASTTEEDRQARTRNRCNGEGYESVALIPLRSDEEIIGLLQLNDRQPNRFTLDMIHFLEELGESIGIALKRAQMRQEAQESLETLKVEREQLLSIFESINEVILVIDPRTYEIIFANKFAETLYGKNLIGGICYEKLSGLDNPCGHCANETIVELRGKSYQWEYSNPVLKRDFMATERMIKWTDGRDVKFQLAVDMTDRKRWERDLEFKNLLLSTQQECSLDGILIVNEDGSILSFNSKFVNIWGVPPKVMETKSDELALQAVLDKLEHPQEFLDKVNYLYEHHGETSHEEVNLKDGRVLERYSSPMLASDGKYYGRVWFFRDITEQKTLQKQLLQAQKMEAVGTLAGGIAHDFNNILQVVLGYSELVIADEALPDLLRGDLGKVLLSARNGADLVQRLLTFSRKTETKPLDLDLNKRIRQTQKFLERTIPKMIDIEMILAEDLSGIHADPTQVDQVLMNLAVNARDAMPEGGKLVIETTNVLIDEEYARSHLEAKPGRYVLLRVSDTGSGIDKETLEHIFEPFYTTKGLGQGTGLGLAMVFGIVKQHQGFINCYSEVGHGTTFKIYLPGIIAETQPDQPVVISIPQGGTETILLVDDEELIRDLGKRILSKVGYTILTASNGQEALDLYRSNKGKISLVMLDLIMPGMGGKPCLEELLKIDPDVKVLVASGYSADGPTKQALSSGAKGFVAKPFDMRQVLEMVRKTIDEE